MLFTKITGRAVNFGMVGIIVHWKYLLVICCCSVTKSCPTLCSPMDCSTPGPPVLHYLPEFVHMPVEFVILSNHLICCHPLLLLPSIFPSIWVFCNESPLHIRWPKYWSFNISLSNEYSRLISFRID